MFVHFLNLGNQYSLGKNVKHCQFTRGGGGKKSAQILHPTQKSE